MKHILEIAEAQLDRTQDFFPRIDAKLTGLLALMLGQIAILVINLKGDDLRLLYIDAFATLFGALILAAGVRLFLCAAPSIDGGNKQSLYFFDSITDRTRAEYISAFLQKSEEERVIDACEQVWQNSGIVKVKFEHLRWATILIVAAAAPWAATILCVSLAHHQMPTIKG